MAQAASVSESACSVAEFDLEILRRKLIAIAVEMSVQLRKTAQILEINQEQDYAMAIVDRTGAVVSTDNPLQLGALSGSARAILKHFRFDMKPGDVIATNVPEFGGTRATDLTLLTPLSVSNAIALYAMVRARMPDFGGMVAGGFYPQATELFAEGVPLTPVKVHREGRPVRDILNTVLLNSRHPEAMRLVLDAMIASMDKGLRRVAALIDDYGLPTIAAAMSHAQDYVERRVRTEIAMWKTGTYYGEASLDHNGRGGPPVTVRVVAHVEGDRLKLDFSDSDDQVPSFLNSTLTTTIGSAVVAVLAMLGDDVPANEGLLRALEITCQPGKLTNPIPTAPVGWSTVHCGSEVTEATSRALRAATSVRHGDLTVPHTLVFGRPAEERGARTPFDSWVVGGACAVEGLDGWGRPAVSGRSILPSVEEWQLSKRLRILSLEYAADSCGHGRWRGAPSVEVLMELPKGYVYTICRQGEENTPQGIQSGCSGSPSLLQIEADDSGVNEGPRVAVETPLPGKRLRLRRGGGAGYGAPVERDPQAVLADVLDELVTPATARSVYRVALTEDGTAIDDATTEQLRREPGE